MEDELYEGIYEALAALVKPDTETSRLFLQEVSQIAAEAAKSHMESLQEAVAYLQDTVRLYSRKV